VSSDLFIPAIECLPNPMFTQKGETFPCKKLEI